MAIKRCIGSSDLIAPTHLINRKSIIAEPVAEDPLLLFFCVYITHIMISIIENV